MSRHLLLALATLATTMGLLDLYSADLGLDGTPGHSFSAQSTHALVGLVAFAVASRLPPDTLRRMALPAWLLGVGLLALTDLTGHVAGGARSWLVLGPLRIQPGLVLGPLRIQPAETWKVILPLALAAAFGREAHRRPEERVLRRLLLGIGLGRHVAGRIAGAVAPAIVAAVIVGVPLALLVGQPDLGSAGLLGLGALCLIALVGIPWWLVVAGGVAALAAAPIAWLGLEDYQRARVMTFWDPTRDPSGDGFQTLQSLYAIASGGPTGRGFLAGTQGRLGFLPEHTTDFILAHLAEEWGFVGAMAALGLLFALISVGLVVAERARDRFGALLAAGLVLQIGVQVVVNAGGILGLLPLTGVTLPFFSYGGSSLVAVWATVGLVASVARTVERRSPLSLQTVEAPTLRVRPMEAR